MTVPPLRTTGLLDAAGIYDDAPITFCDERDRAAGGDVAADAVASVTLSSRYSPWGEFLSWADVLALHAWTGALITAAGRGE
jgi:hypothetical protein